MRGILILFLATLLVFIFDASKAEYIPPGPLYRCPKQSLLLYPCKCETESDVGITVSCQNTNLASMSIGLNNLATFRLPIEKLKIFKCHFARLFGSLLYKLQLRVLHIEDTPIEAIDEYTFLGVNDTLNELYILNSSLIEFPKLAFRHLGNMTVLKIDGHQISSMPTDAFGDSVLSGKLLRLHLANGNLSELPVESLQPLRRLKTLDLHGNKLEGLKRNQFKGLRDTEVLDISFNKISKIDSSHLADLTKMGWCNISHNNIGELTRGAFARNAVLKVLNMSFNKIKRLDTNSFRGMRFLRRLYLSDNLISDVGRGTFASVNRIGTIDLARNFIKKIDYQMFHQLNFIEEIDVSENNVTEIQKLAFKDVYLSNINLSRNSIEKIEVGAFENCANITVLDLSNNKIQTIPKKAFDENTYASELQLSYNFLTEMNQVPLQNMTGLRILNVSHNLITKIAKGTFPKLYELHTIDASYNNLSEIFNAAFQTLFSLRTLDLSYNSLKSIKHSTFGSLPTLLKLDLSYNQLTDLSKSALSQLASTRELTLRGNKLETLFILPISVSHLDLSENEFKELPPKLWPSMNSLLSLNFNRNMLGDNLVKGSFEGLLTLQKLNLNQNGINEVPWASLSDLSSLQYLYLEGNNLTKLNKGAFGRLPVVFEINLANNNLNNITSKAFDGLLQILVLNMTNNNITYIPNGALQGLVSLKTLDLSWNKIEKIDNKTHGLLDDCLSLETIDLSHNKISFITKKTFPSNPYVPYKLREIDLSYNSMPVVTFDLVYGTSKLERLNLSNNAIADIRKGVIGNLTRLRTIDLSHNKLEDVASDNETFRLPVNVSEIYLSNNFISSLPWEHLKNLTHLDLLDIRNNLFEGFGPDLIGMLNNGSDIYFEGNPLNCDCFARPLRRYFSEQLLLGQHYTAIKCHSPPYLADKHLFELEDDRLNCPSNVNTTRIQERLSGTYEITPDLKIRDLVKDKTKIKLKWRVVKNDDIADPYVVIRGKKHPENVVYETTLPYFKRSLEIDLKANLTENIQREGETYQICLLAKDSKTSIRQYYVQQCRDLDGDLGSAAVNTTNLSVILITMEFVMICVYLYCI